MRPARLPSGPAGLIVFVPESQWQKLAELAQAAGARSTERL